LQLKFSTITAPITGRIGLRLVDRGNMVHANDTGGLAVITQLQPITVIFSLPQDDIPRLMKRVQPIEVFGGFIRLPALPTLVEAWDRDNKTLIDTGSVVAIDNQVDPGSGTIRVRARMANRQQTLFSNQFVNARLLVDTRVGTVLVPAAAVQRGPDFTFVYVVKQDQAVEVRKVTVGPGDDDRTVIESGLKAGEVVATDGVDKLQQGTKVTVRLDGGAASRPSTTQPAGGRGSDGQPGGGRRNRGAGGTGGGGSGGAAGGRSQ
jgi:multidrug efflux system membrane fusion protein